MLKVINRLKYFSLLLLLVILTLSCAPTKKNPYYAKRSKSSQVNASQLGRNRYYFSSGYQKKLTKNYKKR
jgi:hypothetical protein